MFVFYSVCFDGCLRCVSWLVRKSLNVVCALGFTSVSDRHCMLDITMKDKALHLIGVYISNDHAEQPDLSQWIKQFRTSCQIVLSEYWNGIHELQFRSYK